MPRSATTTCASRSFEDHEARNLSQQQLGGSMNVVFFLFPLGLERRSAFSPKRGSFRILSQRDGWVKSKGAVKNIRYPKHLVQNEEKRLL